MRGLFQDYHEINSFEASNTNFLTLLFKKNIILLGPVKIEIYF